MRRGLLSLVPRRKKTGTDDEMDLLVRSIERFAPREHSAQREMYYYNYRMLALYRSPLGALLETLAQRNRLNEDPSGFAREIFLRLKDFYDPKGRLNRSEALMDRGLRVKFKQIFVFFYGREAPVLRFDAGGEL